MENKNNTQLPVNTTIYSSYCQIELDIEDFGKSRNQHYKICNQKLLEILTGCNSEGQQFIYGLDNNDIIKNIKNNPSAPPHPSLVWEHCHTSKVITRQEGVMRLVPRSQHNPSSEFWNTIHPEYKNRGGYHEWAVPRGAPVDKPKSYPANFKKKDIPLMKAELIPDALLVALKTNKYSKFMALINRAKQLSFNEQEIQSVLTRPYKIGDTSKVETLLHIACANGNVQFINLLLPHYAKLRNFATITNGKGNSPAHIAAEHNRPQALEKIHSYKFSLNIKNSKGETPGDIAKKRNHSPCISYINKAQELNSFRARVNIKMNSSDTAKPQPASFKDLNPKPNLPLKINLNPGSNATQSAGNKATSFKSTVSKLNSNLKVPEKTKLGPDKKVASTPNVINNKSNQAIHPKSNPNQNPVNSPNTEKKNPPNPVVEKKQSFAFLIKNKTLRRLTTTVKQNSQKNYRDRYERLKQNQNKLAKKSSNGANLPTTKSNPSFNKTPTVIAKKTPPRNENLPNYTKSVTRPSGSNRINSIQPVLRNTYQPPSRLQTLAQKYHQKAAPANSIATRLYQRGISVRRTLAHRPMRNWQQKSMANKLAPIRQNPIPARAMNIQKSHNRPNAPQRNIQAQQRNLQSQRNTQQQIQRQRSAQIRQQRQVQHQQQQRQRLFQQQQQQKIAQQKQQQLSQQQKTTQQKQQQASQQQRATQQRQQQLSQQQRQQQQRAAQQRAIQLRQQQLQAQRQVALMQERARQQALARQRAASFRR